MTPIPLATSGQQDHGAPASSQPPWAPLGSSLAPSHAPANTAAPVGTAPPNVAPPLTQLTRTYLGSTAWGSLTLQKPYITFWISKWPDSSSKPPPDTAPSAHVHPPLGWVPGKMLAEPSGCGDRGPYLLRLPASDHRSHPHMYRGPWGDSVGEPQPGEAWDSAPCHPANTEVRAGPKGLARCPQAATQPLQPLAHCHHRGQGCQAGQDCGQGLCPFWLAGSRRAGSPGGDRRVTWAHGPAGRCHPQTASCCAVWQATVASQLFVRPPLSPADPTSY